MQVAPEWLVSLCPPAGVAAFDSVSDLALDYRNSHIAALAVQLAFFGFATGAVALALGADTDRRSLATEDAAAVAILGCLPNSFAPLVSTIASRPPGW